MGLLPAFINLPGGSEWLILIVVILFLCGVKEAPKIVGTIGQGLRDITGAKRELTKTIEDQVSELIQDAVSPEDEDEDDRKAPRKRKRNKPSR